MQNLKKLFDWIKYNTLSLIILRTTYRPRVYFFKSLGLPVTKVPWKPTVPTPGVRSMSDRDTQSTSTETPCVVPSF